VKLGYDISILSNGVQANLERANVASAQMSRRLSSGYRINTAADDAAGSGMVERLRGAVRSMARAERNVNDGVSLLHTADAGLGQIHSILQRLRELSVQAVNGSLGVADRNATNTEFQVAKDEIDRLANSTLFKDVNVLNGSIGASSYSESGSLPPGKAKTKLIDFSKQYKTKWGIEYDQVSFQGMVGTSTHEVQHTSAISRAAAIRSAAESAGRTVDIEMHESIGLATGKAKLATHAATAQLEIKDGTGTFSIDTAGKTFTSLDGLLQEMNSQLAAYGAETATYSFQTHYAQSASIQLQSTDGRSFIVGASGTAFGFDPNEFGTAGQGSFSVTVGEEFALGGAGPASPQWGLSGDPIQDASIDNGNGTFTHDPIGWSASSNSSANPALKHADGFGRHKADLMFKFAGTSGAVTPDLQMHVGVNATDKLSLRVDATTIGALGLSLSHVATVTGARDAIEALDLAIQRVSGNRARVGASTNRLHMSASALMNRRVNAQASLSQIRDADIAQTTAEYSSSQIKQRAAASMLAQAHQTSQLVLSLLG
jgi:flagellin